MDKSTSLVQLWFTSMQHDCVQSLHEFLNVEMSIIQIDCDVPM